MYFQSSVMKKDHPADLMVCAIARMIQDKEKVFHGVSSQLPMVAMKLSKRLYAKNAILLNIPGGVNSHNKSLSSYSSAGNELWQQSEANFPLARIFDLSMRGELDVAFLSGVQFDVNGHVNASVIGNYHRPKVRLPGGAGSAVLIPTVKKAIIWRTKHDKRTFVEKVDFVTTKGNIYKIITPLAIFDYQQGRLVLEQISPYTTFDEVQANTGFEISPVGVTIIEQPTKLELDTIKAIDPQGFRYNEFTQ